MSYAPVPTVVAGDWIDEVFINTYWGNNMDALNAGLSNLVKIDEFVLAADAADIDFTSIPATYRHLKILLSGRATKGGTDFDYLVAQLNGDSGNNYIREILTGYNVTASATYGSEGPYAYLDYLPAATSPAGYCGNLEITIQNYCGTTFYKIIQAISAYRLRTGANSTGVLNIGSVWYSTAAIDRVKLYTLGGNFAAGTVATLYGIS